MFSFPLLLTVYAGFTHAFETDHLLAVSNIVSQRNSLKLSLKDGISWGLGHASTIFFIGIIMIVFKTSISEHSFHYFEAIVGLMLIILAIFRLIRFFRNREINIHSHSHIHEHETHKHLHVHIRKGHNHTHSLAYGIGLVHGLAGSGALVLLVLAQIKGPVDGLLYLLIFAGGCIIGMMLAAGLFSIPFSRKLIQLKRLQTILIFTTSIFCFLYGGKVIYENLA